MSDHHQNAPKKIYLNYGDGDEPAAFDSDEVTWCEHRIDEFDTEYVRADLCAAGAWQFTEQDLEYAREHMADDTRAREAVGLKPFTDPVAYLANKVMVDVRTQLQTIRSLAALRQALESRSLNEGSLLRAPVTADATELGPPVRPNKPAGIA